MPNGSGAGAMHTAARETGMAEGRHQKLADNTHHNTPPCEAGSQKYLVASVAAAFIVFPEHTSRGHGHREPQTGVERHFLPSERLRSDC